ncbi:flagellar biosynthetic protein FliR [Rhodoblastus acidophilus]|uniref:flagellar biosynthetic protein FliR n=1 Tax=Rhodoblastus acidophilus TaxID=1074 RepID=UPI002224E1CE|nr:flagellar biosynthetic protein FliR [Rhodoblastus acidophilus]
MIAEIVSTAPEMIASIFVLFCRIGACLMTTPGFSSQRIPTRIRLFVALTLTLALTPALTGGKPLTIDGKMLTEGLGVLGGAIFSELLIGGFIGLLGRLFFLAMEAMMMAASMSIGMTNPLGAPIDEAESLPAIGVLITAGATCLIFIMGLHWELIRGVVASYSVMPVGTALRAQTALISYSDTLARTFVSSLRIASPFIVYGIVANFAVGLLNRLTPSIPVYFISGPFLITGGMFLLYFIANTMITAFMADFADWAVKGN